MLNTYLTNALEAVDPPDGFSFMGDGLQFLGTVKRHAVRNDKIRFESSFFNRCYPLLPSGFDPAAFIPVKVTDEALFKGFKKYDVPAPALDPVILSNAKDYLRRVLRRAGVVDCRTVPLVFSVLACDASKGPGFPHSLHNVTRKHLLNSKYFMNDVEKQWNTWADTVDFAPLSSSIIPKYELRDKERVLAQKVRNFSSVPFETLLNGHRMSYDFSEKCFLAAQEGLLPIFGGVDAQLNWKMLYKQLLPRKIFWDTDFSSWDGRCWTVFLQTVYALRFESLEMSEQTPEMRNRYEALCQEICESTCVLETGHVFKKFNGNLSGQPNTFLDNCLVNLLAFYYLAYRHFNDPEEFLSRCTPCACGDDFVVGGEEKDRPFFDSLSSRYSEDLLFQPDSTGVKDNLADVSFVSAKFKVVDNKLYLDRDPLKIVCSLFYSDTEDSLVYRLMRLDAAASHLLGYPEWYGLVLKIRSQEMTMFYDQQKNDPMLQHYNAPDFSAMLEKCSLSEN